MKEIINKFFYVLFHIFLFVHFIVLGKLDHHRRLKWMVEGTLWSCLLPPHPTTAGLIIVITFERARHNKSLIPLGIRFNAKDLCTLIALFSSLEYLMTNFVLTVISICLKKIINYLRFLNSKYGLIFGVGFFEFKYSINSTSLFFTLGQKWKTAAKLKFWVCVLSMVTSIVIGLPTHHSRQLPT